MKKRAAVAILAGFAAFGALAEDVIADAAEDAEPKAGDAPRPDIWRRGRSRRLLAQMDYGILPNLKRRRFVLFADAV